MLFCTILTVCVAQKPVKSTDSITLSDREFKDCLIAQERLSEYRSISILKDSIIKNDSVAFFLKDEQISLLWEKDAVKDDLIKTAKGEVKLEKAKTDLQKTKTRKWQFYTGGAILLGILKESYDVFVNHKL